MNRMILGSASPRRKELLRLAGYEFEVIPSSCEEVKRGETPSQIVENLALDKAVDVFIRLEGPVRVLGADTIVVLDDEILGKPHSKEEAFTMLRSLSGRHHYVYTGVCLLDRDDKGIIRRKIFHECTRVDVLPMTEEEIGAYIATGDPFDKAGAYGIQGVFCKHIRGITGDYQNVVGLPVSKVYLNMCELDKEAESDSPSGKIKAAIFDLDGTLTATLESIAYSTNLCLKDLGFDPLPVDNYRTYAGDGAIALAERALHDCGDTELKLFDRFRELYKHYFGLHCMYHVHPYDGIPELLEELKAKNIPIAICSNKPHGQATKVVHDVFGDDCFNYVQGQIDGIRRKPYPDSAFSCAEKLGVQPCECMYFGDTNTDMQTGTAAGMFTIGVLWGFREIDELVREGAQAIIGYPTEGLRYL